MKNLNRNHILTKDDAIFYDFLNLLCSPEVSDSKEKSSNSSTKTCKHDFTYTINILENNFPNVDIEGTLKYFMDQGAHCDCEILLNVFGW